MQKQKQKRLSNDEFMLFLKSLRAEKNPKISYKNIWSRDRQ